MSHKANWSDRLALLLGQWFFTGRSPIAPGTVGSAGAIPLFWVMRPLPVWIYWGITFAISVWGISISGRCAKILKQEDPPSVVIDEVAGVLIALGLVVQGPLWAWALAWVLFRAFDITKPWLIDKAQYLEPEGLGIMADDLLAGLVAGAITLGVVTLVPAG
jgi:phosphatidylglycerophosphatase A